MKQPSLTDHDAALAAVIRQQNQAADAIGKRQTAAQAIVAAFSTSPTEAGLAQAIAAQGELVALASIADALPDPSRREQALRDSYAVKHRDDLVALMQSDLATRLKNCPAWRKSKAAEVGRLTTIIAERELPPDELASATNRANVLDAEIGNADHRERECRRNLAAFTHDPSAQTFSDARGALTTISF